MGKQSFSLTGLISKRPEVKDYNSLTGDLKIVIDETIREGLKANPILRVKKSFFKTKHIKPIEENFWQLKWDSIIQIKEWVSESNLFEVLNFFYDITEGEFIHLDLFNCFATYKWISEQLKQMREVEDSELSYTPTAEEKMAGSEMLNEYGYYVSLDALTGGRMEKEDYYLNLPYSLIFRKLCLNSTKSQIQRNYLENARRKV